MMHSLVRRVVTRLRRHLLLFLSTLVFLALCVILWRFSGWLLAVLGGMLGLLLVLLWKVPKWQASGVEDIKDRLTIENDARQTLA